MVRVVANQVDGVHWRKSARECEESRPKGPALPLANRSSEASSLRPYTWYLRTADAALPQMSPLASLCF